MGSFNKNSLPGPVGDAKGFTLMELMVVIAIVSTLAAIAIFNYMPIRAKALDSAALSDARNIVDSVVHAIMNNADVQFNNVGPGGKVGTLTTGGNSRKPIFVLSPGVTATITGSSASAPGGNNTVFSALISHTGGTKTYFCFVDANQGISSAPK